LAHATVMLPTAHSREDGMDCCGQAHAVALAHWMWSVALTSVDAMLAGDVGPCGSTIAARTSETASAALDLLRKFISVDVHSHGGKTGITSKALPNDDLANAMRAGSLAVACLADVPDAPILSRNTEGALAAMRPPEPGELYRHHLERLAWIDEMVRNHGLNRALTAAELEAAHNAGQPAIVMDIEGLDFLEMKLERLEEAHQRGVRHAQLVHYTPNEIGDFQTGVITHQGLTSFGAELILACHRLGIVCDVAHATEDTVKQANKVATKPLLLSHTALFESRAMGPTPLRGRQISRDHARAVAETGGSIGIWHFFPSLDKYVEGLKEMVDVVGVDHVSIGTDQHVTPGSVQDYRQWVHLVAAMLRGGFSAEEAGKIAGGNYVRIFRAAVG
jgi:membrane dipeptidase